MNTLDCQTCGACCGPEQDSEGYVDLLDDDLHKIPARLILRRGHNSQLRTVQTKTNGVVCAALRGCIGRKVKCVIYNDRPTLCREFPVGGRDCLESRRVFCDAS